MGNRSAVNGLAAAHFTDHNQPEWTLNKPQVLPDVLESTVKR